MTSFIDHTAAYATRLRSLEEIDLHPLRALMSRAVNEGVTPGLSLWVGVDEGAIDETGRPLLTERSFVEGRLERRELSAMVSDESLFDLASLTKPLAGGRWFAHLVEKGILDPNQPIGEVVKCEDQTLDQTPIKSLLNHSSGLPAHRPYHRGFTHARLNGAPPSRFKSRVRRMIRATNNEYIPGEKSVYSDLGYLLLEEICERLSGDTLLEFWESRSLETLHFTPLSKISSETIEGSAEAQGQYVPTELCSWRKRLLRGEVHDDNAWLMGGVCAHAGLFGHAQAVGIEAAHWLRAISGDPLLKSPSPEVAQWMTDYRQRAPLKGSFVAGWDTPSPGYSSAGSSFSRHTIGHLGFTGTSLWIDIERRVIVTLLTNRVYADRSRQESIKGIRWLRPAIHDELWRLLKG